MSRAERFVRHSKLQTDGAISQAYSHLAPNSLARATLTELLHCVRERSARILGAPVVNGHHLGVEALFELTNSAQLRAEGVALRHCVASYSHRCWRGTSRIWSLRSKNNSSVRSVITIEVDPRKKLIVQARGFRTRPASGKALQLLHTWAARENLQLAI